MFSMLNDNKIIFATRYYDVVTWYYCHAGLLEEIDPTVSLMQVLQTYFDPKICLLRINSRIMLRRLSVVALI